MLRQQKQDDSDAATIICSSHECHNDELESTGRKTIINLCPLDESKLRHVPSRIVSRWARLPHLALIKATTAVKRNVVSREKVLRVAPKLWARLEDAQHARQRTLAQPCHQVYGQRRISAFPPSSLSNPLKLGSDYQNGIAPQPKKVEAALRLKEPKNKDISLAWWTITECYNSRHKRIVERHLWISYPMLRSLENLKIPFVSCRS